MLSMLLALGAGTAAAAPVPETREDPTAVLEELIQRTNELEAFHAIYRLSLPEGTEGSFELWYEAPDSLRLDMRGQSFVERFQVWLVGESWGLVVSTGEGSPSYASVDVSETLVGAFWETLERLFPSPAKGDLGPGPWFTWTWGVHPETEKVEFELFAGWDFGARRALLGWLRTMTSDPELLQVEDDAVVQDHARYRARVSRPTGFLTELVMEGQDGSVGTIRLETLDLEPSLESSVFSIPPRPSGARDFTQELLAHIYPPRILRRQCLGRIDGLLESERIPWNGRTREGCETVFRAMHEVGMKRRSEEWLERMGRWAEEYGEWLLERMDDGAPLEQLREQAAEQRGKLEANLEGTLSEWLVELEEAELPAGNSSHWDELLEIERRAFRAVYDELVRQPILEDFDETVAEALGG